MSSTNQTEQRPSSATEEVSRKSRRTRWEQTAPDGVSSQSTPNVTNSATTELSNQPSDPQAVAAAARAMLAAKAAAAGRSLVFPLTTTSVLSDVAARAAAARAALEKAKRALLMKREQVVALGGVKGSTPMLSAGVVAALRNFPRSVPLRFDRLGRELDEEGQVVDFKPVVHSTLKININREREEKLKQVTHQTRVDRNLMNPESNPWFDSTMADGGGKPKKKGLCFVERGFYTNRERKMRNRMQAEALGFQMTGEAKEAQRQREAAEDEKLKRLLRLQQEGEKEVSEVKKEKDLSEDEGDEFNPNLIPLGGLGASPEKEEEMKKETNSEGEDVVTALSDSDDDHGFSGRGQSLHLLQRKHKMGLIPDVEWWDAPLLQKCSENDRLMDDPDFPYIILDSTITNLIEHPVPIPPVLDPSKPVEQLSILTPKERAKLRRRKRAEKEKDKQDKIRMGLIAPPLPKVKLSNLARVLGKSVAAEPSKIERQVRVQMAQRLRGHEDRNEARRLDDDARRRKTISKYTKQPNDNSVPVGGAKVCVFSVKDLSKRINYVKVDRNAQQFHLTGAAILCPQVGNLIVVEGTYKSLKGFKNLLLKRIKWNEGNEENGTEDDGNQADNEGVNRSEEHSTLKSRGSSNCRLLWEGVVKSRIFKQWKIHTFKAEVEARKLLADRQVEHYWDMLKKYRDPTEDL